MITTSLGMHVRHVVELGESDALVESFKGARIRLPVDNLRPERPNELRENHARFVAQERAERAGLTQKQHRALFAAGY